MRWWLVGTIAGVLAAGSAVAAPFAWLAHESSATVSRTDLATHTAVVIPVGDTPSAVAATDDSSRSTTTPAALANPCDPGAPTITEVADCVLDTQLDRVTESVAAEYGRPCSVATAAGLAALYPRLCP